jgi:hypothetical protein
LLNTLGDNLVDLGTRYRIIFMRKLTPETGRAMVYMWHPDALDTFDNHLGSLSQFFDIPGQQAPRGGDEVWGSSISLIHWRLGSLSETEVRDIESKSDAKSTPVLGSRGPKESQTTMRRVLQWLSAHTPASLVGDAGDSENKDKADGATVKFPPPTIIDPRGASQLSQIREVPVSLVMTGDWERYWTCTVISELIDEPTASKYADEVHNIMQMFIHQHYTGRVLLFLLLPSHLCESLAIECEKFLEELDQIMEMNTIILLKGISWSKSDVALKKLKRMLWGLEALRIFSDKLARAVSEVARAR